MITDIARVSRVQRTCPLLKDKQSTRVEWAIWMRFAIIDFRVPEIGNYVIVLSGCGITILMQPSSVTTSTLTPFFLVKMSPFTVGANVRTTVTGIRHDSCSVSPLLHIGGSAHLVPTAICSDRRTSDVEILGKHRSRHRILSSLVHLVHVRRDSCNVAGVLPGEPLGSWSCRDRDCSVSHCSLASLARGEELLAPS